MTQYGLRVRQEADVVVAELTGDLDSTNVRAVAGELHDVIPGEAIGLVVDLTAVAYLDSAAVALLFQIDRRTAMQRQRLALAVGADSPLRRLLEVTQLDRQVLVCLTVEECIDALREWAGEGFR